MQAQVMTRNEVIEYFDVVMWVVYRSTITQPDSEALRS